MLDYIWAAANGFLVVLGASSLFDQIAEKIKRPRVWTQFDEDRRNFLILVASAVVGLLGGTLLQTKEEHEKEGRRRLEDLDIKLLQFEDVLETASAVARTGAPASFADELKEYVAKYGNLAVLSVQYVEGYVTEEDFKTMERGVAIMLRLVDTVVEEGVTSEASVGLYLEVLDIIRGLRTIVRRYLTDE